MRVRLRAQSLHWVAPFIASLNLPFVLERPPELREQMRELANLLLDGAAER